MAINKYTYTHKFHYSLGESLSRLFDISDLFDLYDVEAKYITIDSNALRSDWAQVGKDIKFGISAFESEYPELHHGR